MAQTLQEILNPTLIPDLLHRVISVHRLENVDGDPIRLRTACGRYEFVSPLSTKLIDDLKRVDTVTCPKCLEVMADQPIIVETT